MQLPDKENFNFKDCNIAGDPCWLITPKNLGVTWTDENARFRSCIVRQSDNYVISQSLPKFVNFFETPTFQPWNPEWPINAYHKKDGSLVLLSCYKGRMILRTRGTVDVFSQETGTEVHRLIENYPKIKDFVRDGRHTVAFEHTTPNRVIVLREDAIPTLTLLAIIDNETAYLYHQNTVDLMAIEWNIPRPRKYTYKNISECIADVEAWKHAEGVVLYSPDCNTLKKIKSSEYLTLHKCATGIRNMDNVLDVFMASPRFVNPDDFYKYIADSIDFEVAEKCKEFIKPICKAYDEYLNILNLFIKGYMDVVMLNKPTRKEQAMAIQNEFEEGWEKAAAFMCLDKREPDDKLVRKAMEARL